MSRETDRQKERYLKWVRSVAYDPFSKRTGGRPTPDWVKAYGKRKPYMIEMKEKAARVAGEQVY